MRRVFIAPAVIILLLGILFMVPGCGEKQAVKSSEPASSKHAAGDELGSESNPIKIAVVPSIEAQKLIVSGEMMGKMLEKETGYKFKTTVPASYAAVVEGLGGETVDAAWMPPLAYVLANEKYGAQVLFMTQRGNATHYQSFILARTDSGINSLEDLKGKKFAFGDPLSTSGTLYPKLMFEKTGILDPEKYFSKVLYAGSHDKVVTSVYQGSVDAGAIYGGSDTDAREQVAKTLKDIYQKTKIIAKSDNIPNDTLTVRKGLSDEMLKKLQDGMLKVSQSPEGKKLFQEMFGIDAIVPAKDSDYESVREAIRAAKLDIEEAVQKKK